jgi:hypothetical protein
VERFDDGRNARRIGGKSLPKEAQSGIQDRFDDRQTKRTI